MQVFEMGEILEERARGQRAYLEFLHIPVLSAGVYHLKAGQFDPQQPHTEDEVYYVLSGKARFRCGQEQVAVGPGSVLFVERAAEHRFFDITEDLTVLVIFAPAEGRIQPQNAD
jgi:mannose-6-phosphate isomerase-like protein (cupin superfamily)